MGTVLETITRGQVDVPVVDAADVGVTGNSEDLDGVLGALRTDVNSAISQAANRPQTQGFLTFRASINLTAANLPQFVGRSILFTEPDAQAPVFVTLPTDQEIADAVGVDFPVSFEFIHYGGIDRSLNNVVNVRIDLVVPGAEEQIRNNNGQLVNFETLNLLDGLILTKADNASPWQASRFTGNPTESLLPTGLFNLRNDVTVPNILNIANSFEDPVNPGLGSLAPPIARGDAFLVAQGGTYFGTVIDPGDVIVAESATPNLLTGSNDWLIVRNTNNAATSAENQLLLSNFARSGIRFDGNRNVFVNEANVAIDEFPASPFPYTEVYAIPAADDTGPTLITLNLSSSVPAFNFDDLVGGRVEISVQYRATRTGSVTPGLRDLRLIWTVAGITMTFNALGVSSTNGVATLATTIPDVDYSGIVGVAPDLIEQDVEWRGTLYQGAFLITALRNIRTGPLHNAVLDIAQTAAANALVATQAAVQDLQDGVAEFPQEFLALEPRLSPLRSILNESQDVEDVYFGDDLAANPQALASYTRIDPNHATFVITGTDVIIITGTQHRHILHNNTSGFQVELSRQGAQNSGQLSLEASFSDTLDGVVQTFFVYRSTGHTIGDSFTVREAVTTIVAAWQDDINSLRASIAAIAALVRTNVAFNLPQRTQDWLANDLSIVDVSTPVFDVTAFNRSFTTDGSQGFFLEELLQDIPGSGFQQTQAMVNVAGRRGRKTIFMPLTGHVDTGTIIQTFGGTIPQAPVLVTRQGNDLMVRRFLGAVPATQRVVARFPTPAGRVGDWFRVPGHDPVTLQGYSTEIAFTENLPQVSTAVTWRVRWESNGQTGGQITLGVFVGGDADLFTTGQLTLATGDIVDVTVRYRARQRDVEIQFVPRGDENFFNFDYGVQGQWNETITTPAQAASSELVFAGQYLLGSIVPIMFGPSNTRSNASDTNLIISTPTVEIDTGYKFNELFTDTDSGALQTVQPAAGYIRPVIMQHVDAVETTETAANQLNLRARQPFNGLFVQNFTSAAVATSDTQVAAVAPDNSQFTLGTDLILQDTDPGSPNAYYRVTVDKGTIVTTLIT